MLQSVPEHFDSLGVWMALNRSTFGRIWGRISQHVVLGCAPSSVECGVELRPIQSVIFRAPAPSSVPPSSIPVFHGTNERAPRTNVRVSIHHPRGDFVVLVLRRDDS